MSSKKFLLQECGNLKKVLEETLRYKYGFDGSKGFFDECEARLKFIEQEIIDAGDNDHKALDNSGRLLNYLSALVSRIERSSLGEYSWPFVEELKKISSAICTESTLFNQNTPPLVYVFSEGGLDAYCIYPERKRPSASKQRILTIVFPRTLKHFVLLHSILGHEIGHAIWRSSKHQNSLRAIVEEELKDAGGKFKDPATTANWIYDANSPKPVADLLGQLVQVGINQNNLFQWANWEAWIEEILCDLLGLLIFGPSFVGAQSELLYALGPSGAVFGDEHPPVGCRVNMILQAATLLKLNDTTDMQEGPLKESVNLFWKEMEGRRQTDPWYNVFSNVQLGNALTRIGALLDICPPTKYPSPSNDVLLSLLDQISRHVPPIGFKVDKKGGSCFNVDFRHILYAGWIAKIQIPQMPFLNLNRLCEHAIMQQCGIDKFLTGVQQNGGAVT